MRVLLLGDYPAAMFLLSSEPGYIINMTPVCRGNTPKSIESFLDLCSFKDYSTSSVTIYNDTPWSHLLVPTDEEGESTRRIKNKIYKLGGWEPDLIIYVYTPGEKDKHPLLEHNKDIPVFSTNARDSRLLHNLTSIINENQKKLPPISICPKVQ